MTNHDRTNARINQAKIGTLQPENNHAGQATRAECEQYHAGQGCGADRGTGEKSGWRRREVKRGLDVEKP